MVLAVTFVGCASWPTQDQPSSLGSVSAEIAAQKVRLQEFTLADLQQAEAIANEPPLDQAGAACWPVLIQHYQARISAQHEPVKGLASLFERVRKIVSPQAAPDDSLSIACSALRDQAIVKIIQIDAKIAALVASGGVSGISDLPSALAAARKVLGLMKELGVVMP